jgi:hypothetical protein
MTLSMKLSVLRGQPIGLSVPAGFVISAGVTRLSGTPDYNHTEMPKGFELFGSNLLWDHHLDGRTSFAVISLGVIALAHSRQRSRKPRVICAER